MRPPTALRSPESRRFKKCKVSRQSCSFLLFFFMSRLRWKMRDSSRREAGGRRDRPGTPLLLPGPRYGVHQGTESGSPLPPSGSRDTRPLTETLADGAERRPHRGGDAGHDVARLLLAESLQGLAMQLQALAVVSLALHCDSLCGACRMMPWRATQ